MSRSTKKSFKKGDVLLSEKPFAFVLYSNLNSERCDFCFKRSQLLKCAGCSFAHYCDKTCQKNGWTYHKYECLGLKKIAPRVAPIAARLLARILIKLHMGGGQEKSYYTDSKFRVFKDLMSHYNDIKKDIKRTEHFISLYVVLHELLESHLIPNEAELLAIYGRMIINTFGIVDDEMRSIGCGLYLAASVIDHSCAPNAVAMFDSTKILIKTLENIETLNWSNVYISYIEVLELPPQRQEELKSCYYFLCQCKRCADVEEVYSMTSTICQNEKCNMCIKGGLLETVSVCSHCHVEISQQIKEEYMEVLNFTKDQLDKMKNLAYLDVCRVSLKRQEKIFHPLNIFKVKTLDLALEACIELGDWENAFNYGKQLVEPFQKYYGDLNPLRGILLLKLGKVALYLNLINEAEVFLKEAATVLFITHDLQLSKRKNMDLNKSGQQEEKKLTHERPSCFYFFNKNWMWRHLKISVAYLVCRSCLFR